MAKPIPQSEDESKPTDPAKKFANHFRKQVGYIETLQCNGHSRQLYQKALFVCVLDTLAKPIYPKKGSQDRFTAFVERFCGWEDGSRVSLTHLVQLVRRSPEPDFEPLRLLAFEQFKKWPVHGSGIVKLGSDPDYKSVKANWPGGHDDKRLRAMQHFSLLYAYRTFLVHEMREPGRGMEFADTQDPHYHLLSNISQADEIEPQSVELVYPVGFFSRLCNTGVDEFERYMVKNELDPYDYFDFGTYWLPDFNE
jgi:hypothetical protein